MPPKASSAVQTRSLLRLLVALQRVLLQRAARKQREASERGGRQQQEGAESLSRSDVGAGLSAAVCPSLRTHDCPAQECWHSSARLSSGTPESNPPKLLLLPLIPRKVMNLKADSNILKRDAVRERVYFINACLFLG